MDDQISRQDAIDYCYQLINVEHQQGSDEMNYGQERVNQTETILHHLEFMPSTQSEQRWIPFETRPLTKEEKEEHPEWDGILDCKLPYDGQRILVTIRIRGHEEVQQDEFYHDDGCYLDSGYEIGTEAVAWMPMPEPYAERRKEGGK